MKIARWFWYLAFGISIVILVGALPGYWTHIKQLDDAAEFSAVQQFATALGLILSIGCALLSVALAALLFAQKPNDAMALFLAFYLLMYGAFLAGPIEMFMPFWFPAAENLGLVIQSLVFPVPTLIFILVFPNGRFAPRWTRWLIILVILSMLFGFLTIHDAGEIIRGNTPAAQIMYAVTGTMLIVALGIQFYRYRRTYTLLERQQTKWVVYGFTLSYVLLALVSIPYYYVQNLPPDTPAPWWTPLGGVGWWLSLSIQPLAFTLAILRFRLFDIDILIRRTLIYSIITATLAVFYLAAVILLQQLFRAFTGTGDDLAIIVSTLAIAALFNPLRRRVQDSVDHRFYRRKYDAQQVLERFAQTVRDEVELEKLSGELLNVVNETMQPTSVSLWLKKTEDGRRRMDG